MLGASSIANPKEVLEQLLVRELWAACHAIAAKATPLPLPTVPRRVRLRDRMLTVFGQYEKVLRSIKREGRYKGRQKEVAARIVNKTRRRKGETKGRRKAA